MAWRPAARLRPAASYMTIRLKNSVTPNSDEPKPSRNPTKVERLDTEAACELGMPPVSTNRRRFQCRVRDEIGEPLVDLDQHAHRQRQPEGLH